MPYCYPGWITAIPREQEQFGCDRILYKVVQYKYYLHISNMAIHMDNLVNFLLETFSDPKSKMAAN